MPSVNNVFLPLDAQIPGGLRIRYKDESVLMRLIGAALVPNPRFLTHFTTTLGRTVYFPSRAW